MRPAKVTLALLALATLLTPTALGQFGFPDGEGPRMEIMEGIYNQIIAVAIVVFLFVFGWLAFMLVRYRQGGHGKRTNEAHRGHAGAEIAWTIVPLIIMIWVGWISYVGMVQLDFDTPETEHEVTITGFQWFWKADYGEGVSVAAQPGAEGEIDQVDPFLIPADTPVLLNLTAGDVIHALWIPDLGVKVDATPGRSSYVWVEAPEGEYFTQCAEYCGLAHAYMRAKFQAIPLDDYEDWLAEQARAASGAGGITVRVDLTDDGFTPDTIEGLAGIPLQLRIDNQRGSATTVELADVENGTAEIAAGSTGWLNVTADAGDYELTADGATATVTLAEAEVIDVELGDFFIEPESYALEQGKTYVFRIANTGGTVHNLFGGDFAAKSTIFESETLDPGESGTLVFTPDESGTYDVWCNIPGHYQLGMQGQLTVN